MALYRRARNTPLFFPGPPIDGSTNDSPALQEVIYAARDAGGGIVQLEQGRYAIGTTLDMLDMREVTLRGAGADHDIYDGTIHDGTILEWTGSAGGTVISMGTTVAEARAMTGLRVEELSIDGQNSAAVGILQTSSCWGGIRNVHVRECTTVAIDLTTVDLSGLEVTQGNVYEQISTRQVSATTGIGWRLGSAGPGLGNTCLNTFLQLICYHRNGAGIKVMDADGNRFLGVNTNRYAGATGYGVEFWGNDTGPGGHARHNAIYHLQPALGGVLAKDALVPSQDNFIFGYSLGNSAPLPVVEPGASLMVYTDGYIYSNPLGIGGEADLARGSANYGLHVQDVDFAEVQVEGTSNTSNGYVDVKGKESDGTVVHGVLKAVSGGSVIIGSESDHRIIIVQNDVEVLRIGDTGIISLGPTGSGPQLRTGTGSPEGVITAPVGSFYLRTNGGAGTSLYVKESGTGDTGWVGK